MDIPMCPFCGGKRLVDGKLVGHAAFRRAQFKPRGLRFKLTLTTSAYLEVDHEACVCIDCGTVIGTTNPQVAQDCIERLGTDELKDQMEA